MASSIIEIQRKLARLRKIFRDAIGKSGQTYVYDRVAEYRELWKSAAAEAGASFTVIDDKVFEVTRDNRRVRILNHILPFDDPVTLEIAGMKPLVYRLLTDKGIPVPEHLVFDLHDWHRAIDFMKQHPEGVVVKPANGTSAGQGVTTHILTKRELRRAAVLASLYCRELLVETMIPGECYRLLVLNGKMVHAVCRRGPRLEGDGVRSIIDLIRIENERRKKENRPLLDIDRDTTFTLGYQRLTPDSIPAEGQVFLVKSVNDPFRKQVEVRTVYDTVMTDEICESLKRTAETVAESIGSRLVGVDIITTNPGVPLSESGGVVNEANTTPGLHHHYNAAIEKHPKPAVEALDTLLSS